MQQVISLGESYFGLQEECHSRARDRLQQKPGAGIKKYITQEQEDQIDQQSEVVQRNEQRVDCTSAHRDIWLC